MGETRVTIQEAARILGVSEGAIRKRVKRNTLRHDKASGGRVYVYLDAGVDEGVDEASHPDTTALISRLENEVQFLREELARKDAVMLSMTEAIKAISPGAQEEPIQEPPESPVSATPQPGRVEPQPSVEAADEQQGRGPVPGGEGPQTASERPWWRRVFGG